MFTNRSGQSEGGDPPTLNAFSQFFLRLPKESDAGVTSYTHLSWPCLFFSASTLLSHVKGAGHCGYGGDLLFGPVCTCHTCHSSACPSHPALPSCPQRVATTRPDTVDLAPNQLATQSAPPQLLHLWLLHVQPSDWQQVAPSLSNSPSTSR